MEITANSYFCGAGLFDSGLIQGGIKIGQAFELDRQACKTYAYNLGNHIRQCDLTEELVLEQDSCDIMVFTYPCTKYSVAADLFGTRTGDELFLHALRHIAIASPEGFIVENVPGMKAFPVVMETLLHLPQYYTQLFCPVDANLWLPQNRKRIIIFASKRDFPLRSPENMRPVTLAEIMEHDVEMVIPESVRTRMNGGYRDLPIISDPSQSDIAPLCVAHYSKDRSTRLVVDKNSINYKGVRPYTVREYARLQGVSDDFKFPVTMCEAFRQIGNGVPIPFGIWLGQELIRYFKMKRFM